MALFRKLFYKKPPDGLLEICEHVYVFDCCFTIDAYEEENYKVYIKGIVSQLQDHFPEASFLVFNFREGETQSQMAEFLSDHDMTIMDYPRQYEGSPLLAMEVLHHFLRSCESWLSLGQNNFLLMHCERGGWPVMAFMLAALLLYRKQYCGEQKTLDMIYRQAPCELLQLLSPLNPMPSQLRYLQYISRRNVASEWPPLDRALTLDCVILRYIPNFDGEGGCRPIFRIYGQDPFLVADRNPKVLYSTPKRSKLVRHYKQKECPLVKIDINCHIQGDVVVECISLHNDMEREVMVFRVVFNTAFIRSNILMLNRDEVDTLWDAKELFPKEFRAEILFSEMDAASSIISMEFPTFEEKEGLPVEAFAKVHEIFSNVDWLDPRTDIAFNMLQQIGASNIILEKSDSEWNSTVALSPRLRRISPKKFQEETKLIVSPSSPRSPSFMSMRTQSTPLQRSSLDSNKNMEAKPQDSHFEPLSSSDVICQENNQSTTKPLVNDSVSCVPAVAANHSLAISHMQQAVETKSISILPQAQLSTAAVQHPPTSSVTKAPPNVPQPPPLPAPLSSASELARSSHVNETGTNLQHKDQPPLVDQAIAEKNSFPITTSTASSSTSSSAVAVNSTLPATLTPHLNEEPTIRGIPSTDTPPAPTTTSFRDLPQESPSSLEANFTPTITALAAPKPPIASPLNDIKVVKDGPIIFPPAPPTPPLPPSPSKAGVSVAPPPPPPPPPPPLAPSQAKVSMAPPPPPMPHLKETTATKSTPPPPPPPPSTSKQVESPTISSSAPPPPPPPGLALSSNSSHVPVAPSPPPPFGKKTNAIGGSTPAPPALSSPINSKNKLLSRTISSKNHPTKKLKPLHWLKLSRAVQGSLWAEAQKLGEASKPPEIDMSELENLFSAAAPCTDRGGKSSSRNTLGPKSDKVQLIDHRRAYNCEIMLSKVKVPLHDLMSSVLALEESALDVDQVDNLIKFCPTKEEMEVLKGYTGEMEKLGKCELFFLELMQVPRVESKLRVFSFKIQFRSQVSDLRKSLNVVNSATKEIRNSVKLKRIMQTILSLGNALNQGTARGSAIGFRLDSLLKLTETRARNNRMTLMHYLCKVVADKLPELLDFSKDVSSLEPASKIQLKFLAEEMQAISKGLEKVVQELSSSENDGHVSEKFREALKEFLCFAEAEVRSLASLYSGVGRNVDALILYFGEDPARCLFEQVISTLLNFVRMFNKAHEENCKQLEQDAKKSAENEKMKMNAPQKETGNLLRTSIESKQS